MWGMAACIVLVVWCRIKLEIIASVAMKTILLRIRGENEEVVVLCNVRIHVIMRDTTNFWLYIYSTI